MLLAEAAWPAVADADATLAVVPVGSTEQHGPHAPLGTDTLAAAAVAEAASERIDEPVLQTPPLTVGISSEHRHFPGTLWLTPETFRAVVTDTAESVLAHGIEGLVFVNGHGGNAAALREVAAACSRRYTAHAAAVTWFEAVETDIEMGHAGALETAVVRHLAPELVDEEAAEAAAEEGADRWGQWVRGVNIAYDTETFSTNGTVGDPSETTAADGEAVLTDAAAAVADVIRAVRDRTQG